MSGDESSAAELTQDVFVRVWRELGKFRGGNIQGWIQTVGRNVILNDKRSRARFASLISFEDDVASVEPPGARVSRETALTISAAIETLPLRGKSVFQLHDIDGYSAEEIAELMGISAATVRVHLHRARKKIASVLVP